MASEPRRGAEQGCGGVAERFAADDVLRFLGEKGASSIESVVEEVGDRDLALTALESLERRGLVRRRGDRVELTREGRERARAILEPHVVAERIASRLGGVEPHVVAHCLEHFPESIRLLERLRPRRPVRLVELPRGAWGYVIGIVYPRPRILARLLGAGVVPGRRVGVFASTPAAVLVIVGSSGRLVALDRRIAEAVLVAPG